MATFAFPGRRLEQHDAASIDLLLSGVTEAALHAAMRAGQGEGRSVLVIKQSGLPLERLVASAALGPSRAGQELAFVRILVAARALLRR